MHTITIFNTRFSNRAEAEDAGELYSVDVESNVSVNDVCTISDAVVNVLKANNGVKCQFVNPQ